MYVVHVENYRVTIMYANRIYTHLYIRMTGEIRTDKMKKKKNCC